MGFNKRFKIWEHIDDLVAIMLLGDFDWWHLIIGLMWKRYVFADHVKVIVEKPPCDYWFVRSIFRSRQQIGLPHDMLNFEPMRGYIAIKDEETGTFEVINSTIDITVEEYRELYKQCGGTGNW